MRTEIYFSIDKIIKIFNLSSAAPQNQVRPQAPANAYDPSRTGNNQPIPPQDPSNGGTAYPFRFSNPQSSVPSPQTAGHPLAHLMANQQQQQQQTAINYGSRFPFMSAGQHQPPTQISGQSQPQQPTRTPPGVPAVDKNWQDGLRALLPNINISFSSKLKL